MKRLLLFLVAVMAMAGTMEAQNVYIAPSNSAIAYHKTKNCSYLKNSVNVTAISTTKAKEMGRHACVRCYPEQKQQTLKNIEKEKATKKTVKKTTASKPKKTTTAKKDMPERDEKGRFVKKTDTQKKTETKKATPARDEKGRFVKKTDTQKKTETKKTTPARDEKGRFIKKDDTEKKTTKKTTKKAA